jgi:hypothetical protein
MNVGTLKQFEKLNAKVDALAALVQKLVDQGTQDAAMEAEAVAVNKAAATLTGALAPTAPGTFHPSP